MQIFILGTGRSGTHWVGRILEAHPDIRVTIETPRTFRLATRAAVYPRRRGRLLPVLRGIYAWETLRSRPRHYADKSHPLIWHAEEVARWFPSAKFVGINRSVFGTVASMLRHSGVSQWQKDWLAYDVPNAFLGITLENVDRYGDLTPAERAALRWRSHQDRMTALDDTLGSRLMILNYEDLVDNYDARVSDLWSFLEVRAASVQEHRPNMKSRDAWRDQLSPEQIAAVAAAAGVVPPI